MDIGEVGAGPVTGSMRSYFHFFISFIAVPVFLFLFSPILSAECLVFGPREFRPSTAEDTAIEARFENPNPAGSSSILIVENGDKTGEMRVSSATVRLNGKKVVSERNFRDDPSIIEKQVSLRAQNVLEVDLQGDAGSLITVRIASDDAAAPSLEISRPAFDPEWVRSREFILEGRVDDPAALVRANGNSCGRDGNSFSCSLRLKPGDNTLSLEATDFCGNRSGQSRTVVFLEVAGLAVVDSRGGRLAVAEAGNALRGTMLEIPPKEFRKRTPIIADLAGEETPPAPDGMLLAGPVAEFTSPGNEFRVPATVGLPFDKFFLASAGTAEKSIFPVRYDENTGRYIELPVDSINVAAGVVYTRLPQFSPGRYAAALWDTVPPVTSLTLDSGAFTIPAAGISFMRGDFEFLISAADPPIPETGVRTGIREKSYRIDGGEWHRTANPWKESFFIPKGGEHTIEYFGVDRAGNVEEPARLTRVYIDDIPPVITSFSLPRILGKGILEIQLEAGDAGCGKDFLRAGLSETPDPPPDREFFPLLGPAAFAVSEKEGRYTVYGWTKDCVGNLSNMASGSFTIDTNNPALTVTAPETRSTNRMKTTWVKGTVYDSTSEVSLTIRYIEGGRDVKKTCPRDKKCSFSENFSLQPGFNTFVILAVDTAGNRDSEIRGVFLDRVPPITTPTVQSGDPLFIDPPRATWYIHPQSRMVLISNDSPEDSFDVPAAYYRVGSKDYQLYQGPFNVLDTGFNRIEFYGIDAAGNKEASKSMEVFVDAYPPEIKSFAVQEVITTPEVLVTSSELSDVGSGVWKRAVKEANGADQPCPEPPSPADFVVSEELAGYKLVDQTDGPHTICVWYMDRVGNVSRPVSATTLFTYRTGSVAR